MSRVYDRNTMKRSLRFFAGFTLGLMFAACNGEPQSAFHADAAVETIAQRTAELTEVEGAVKVKRSGTPDWLAASAGMQLAINDKVRTQRASFATIRFDQGGHMRLEPESLVAVTDLRMERRNQTRRSTFTLMQGRVEAELDALTRKGSEFKIKTPSAQASVVRREVTFQ
jgi:hypothetical protein